MKFSEIIGLFLHCTIVILHNHDPFNINYMMKIAGPLWCVQSSMISQRFHCRLSMQSLQIFKARNV